MTRRRVNFGSCINLGCKNDAFTKGLCQNCYASYKYKVRKERRTLLRKQEGVLLSIDKPSCKPKPLACKKGKR